MSEKREVQKEFFNEFTHEEGARKMPLGIKPTKKLYNLTFSNEQIIFAVIGFVILMVICFSLGVERGKRIGVVRVPAPERRVAETPTKPKSVVVKKKPVTKKTQSEYVIQVAAFRSKAQANEERGILVKDGYSTEISASGRYSVVYAIGFRTRKEAEASLTKLRNKYKDCFIRRR